MKRQLPGLTAIRTFEAAARHRSFSRAAQELSVTPAAVSYLVRDLETQLNVQLFSRSGRGVGLTQAGEILRDSTATALDDIERAIERIRNLESLARINVTTTPSFAMKWLVPRLNRFLTRFPDIDVRIDMSRQVVDFSKGEMDLAIRFGTDRHPGLLVHRLLTDSLIPVCSPHFFKAARALRQPRDLLQVPLIQSDFQAHGEIWPTWQMWFELAGLPRIQPKPSLRFNQSVLAIQAALDGQGVALADASLVEFDLAAGRLVTPFDISIPTPAKFAYWIVMPSQYVERPLVDAFRHWLLEEAADRHRPPQKQARARRQAATKTSKRLA